MTPRRQFEQGLIDTFDSYLHNESCWQLLLERPADIKGGIGRSDRRLAMHVFKGPCAQ
jgi:hypothetical protein